MMSTLVAALVTGCIYLPQTNSRYNPECEIEEKHMTLEEHQVATIGRCRNDECVALLAVAGVVSAASVVISGTVVVTGNVVYWMEKTGACLNQNGAAKLK